MNLNELTLGDVKKLQTLLTNGKADEPMFEVGKCYFIRTVTHHYTGRCTKVASTWIELDNAAWIADDGRFNEFLKTGEANEVEPYVNPVGIPLAGIIDRTEWQHALPKEVK